MAAALPGPAGGVVVVLNQGGDDGALARSIHWSEISAGSGEAGRLGQLVEVVAGAGLVGEHGLVGRVAGVGELTCRVRQALEARLARYKLPKRLHLVDTLDVVPAPLLRHDRS